MDTRDQPLSCVTSESSAGVLTALIFVCSTEGVNHPFLFPRALEPTHEAKNSSRVLPCESERD